MTDKLQHVVTCFIDLGGDIRHSVHRGIDNPVAWTEIPILKAMHGEAAVHDIELADTVERLSVYNEKQRLLGVYGAIVEQIYPGATPNFEWFVPGQEPDPNAPQDDKPKRRIAAGVIAE